MAESALAYASQILIQLAALPGTFEPEPLIDEQAESRVLVRLVRQFDSGTRLAVTVLIDSAGGSVDWLKYSFHYMDADDLMIFRYDNTPHHGDLPGFPHHKHVGTNESAVDSEAPTIEVILAEIRQHLAR